MRNYVTSGARRALFALVAIFCAASLNLAAQQAGRRRGPTAGEENENLKVLGRMPAEDFNQTMHLMSGDLGVDCEYCHLEKDRVTDQIKAKVVARDMLKMTIRLNKRNFKGEQVVTCYTCHQGRPIPNATPVMPMHAFPEEKEAKNLPSPAQVISKYIEALGGEQKLRAVTSRVVMANQGIPAGPGGTKPVQGTSEHYQKAPNLLVNIYHAPKFTTLNGFDGKRAWAQAASGRVAETQSLEQIRTARDADLQQPLKLQEIYPKLTVEKIEKINGRDCYLVVGIPKENIPDKLYFDVETGLLVRKTTIVPTPIGDSPYEVNYDDYRTTNSGVKYPFTIHTEPSSPRLELITSTTIKATDVKDNVPIDDAKFVRPVSKEPPPAPPTAPAKGAAKKS
jgi:Photosynthetic reaction centre cytochrome C subunit